MTVRRRGIGALAGPPRAGARYGGFSLVEAMVALVVLSVGMIGIAALHGQSLAANRTAQLRTQAVNLTADMADRVRLNRLGGAAYAGPSENRSCDPQSGGGVDCTPQQMAEHDVLVWQQQVARLLPDGVGAIRYDGATIPPTYSIEVAWTEVGAGTLTQRLVIQVPER
jgi:type IV pilus assembly protein PilV